MDLPENLFSSLAQACPSSQSPSSSSGIATFASCPDTAGALFNDGLSAGPMDYVRMPSFDFGYNGALSFLNENAPNQLNLPAAAADFAGAEVLALSPFFPQAVDLLFTPEDLVLNNNVTNNNLPLLPPSSADNTMVEDEDDEDEEGATSGLVSKKNLGRTSSGAIRKRRPKVPVPEEVKKTAQYIKRREKNNAAAARNRMMKRLEAERKKDNLPELTQRQAELREECDLLRAELNRLIEDVHRRMAAPQI